MLRDPLWACTGCAPQLLNGGFEAGGQNWSTGGVDFIVDASHPRLTASPYAGSWLSWLGGRNSSADQLSQDFALPEGVSSIELRYFVQVDTQETSGVYDSLAVRLRGTDGSLLRTIDQVDNSFSPGKRWAERVIRVDNIGGWSGQVLRLSFEATTDATAVTSFYIDEVSIK